MLLFPVVDSYFLVKGWPVQHHESLQVLRLNYYADEGAWVLYVQAREERRQVLAYSVLQELVDAERRPAVVDLLNRLNAKLAIGGFEMDPDSGEVRFRTGLEVRGETLTEAMLDPVIETNLATVEDYLPAIHAVLGGTTPAQALADVQGKLDSFDIIFR